MAENFRNYWRQSLPPGKRDNEELLDQIIKSLNSSGITELNYKPFRCTSVLEILSVNLTMTTMPSSGVLVPCGGEFFSLHGTMSLVSEEEEEKIVFNRENSEEYIMGTNLPITLDNAIIPFSTTSTKLKVDLKVISKKNYNLRSGSGGAKFDDVLHFELPTHNQIAHSKFDRNGLCLAVSYIVHSHAVVSNLGLCFGDALPAYVYGRICAHMVDSYSTGSSVEECNKLAKSTEIFERPGDNPITVPPRSSIGGLSRSVVVVPAYSVLLVEVDVWKRVNEGQEWDHFKKMVTFAPSYYAFSTESISRDKDFSWGFAIMTARWSLGGREVASFYSSGVSMPQQLAMEISHISIHQFDREIDQVFGTIVASSNDNDPLVIYEKDEGNCVGPSVVSDLELSSTTLVGSKLAIKVDLKQPDGRFLSKGTIELDKVFPIKCDIPLCSVIRGEAGYVAIHYKVSSCIGQS